MGKCLRRRVRQRDLAEQRSRRPAVLAAERREIELLERQHAPDRREVPLERRLIVEREEELGEPLGASGNRLREIRHVAGAASPEQEMVRKQGDRAADGLFSTNRLFSLQATTPRGFVAASSSRRTGVSRTARRRADAEATASGNRRTPVRRSHTRVPVAPTGVDPVTSRFSVVRSTN